MDVVKELDQIEGKLARMEAGDLGVGSCADLEERFQQLRALYVKRPAMLDPHLDRLKALSARLEEYQQSHMRELVDEYHRLNELMRESKRAKEHVRELLINEVAVSGSPNLVGRECRVHIQAVRAPRLPKPGSRARNQLEQLIQEAGRWELVSQLSPRLLGNALTDRTFDTETTQTLQRLVPQETSYRLVSKSRLI